MSKSKKHQKHQPPTQRRRVVYGVLLSELDDAESLIEEFERTLTIYDELQYEYQNGDITAAEYALSLQQLAFTYNGVTWTVGATSGRWYAKQNDHWTPAQPPRANRSRGGIDVSLPDSQDGAFAPDESVRGDLLGEFLDSGMLDQALSATTAPVIDPAEQAALDALAALETANTVLPGLNVIPPGTITVAPLTGAAATSAPTDGSEVFFEEAWETTWTSPLNHVESLESALGGIDINDEETPERPVI